MTMTIRAETLTREAFVPFGDVISAPAGAASVKINAGSCDKFARLATIDCDAQGGLPVIHIYRAKPLPLPIRIAGLERHNLGSQAFIPLSGRPYLVVVAPAGYLKLDQLRVFRASGQQGVQFRRGTWHHFCLALEAESEFLVIDRDSSEVDCDEVALRADHQIEIDL